MLKTLEELPLLAFVTIAYIVGIIFGLIFQPSFIFLYIISFVIFVFCVFGYRQKWSFLTALILLFFVLIGAFFYSLHYSSKKTDLLKPWEGKTVILEGVICQDVDQRPNKTILTIKIHRLTERENSYSVSALVRLITKGNNTYSYGDVLRVEGVLGTPSDSKNIGGFSSREYLARQGIHHFIFFMPQDADNIKKLGTGRRNFLFAFAFSLKERIRNFIGKLLPQPQSSLWMGIVLGERSSLPQDIQDDFFTTGTTHVLAASGSNVGIVAFFFLGLFSLIRIPLRISAVLAIVPVILYVLVVGDQPSVVRAGIMAVLGLIAVGLEREKHLLNFLFLSAFLLLVINPLQIFDIGFQLSYLAVLGLMLFMPIFDKWLMFIPKYLRKILSGTLAAQLAVLPLIMYYFNQFSLVSPLANLLIVPLCGLILSGGIFTLLAAPLHPLLAQGLGGLNWLLLFLTIKINHLFASLPFASFSLPTPPLIFVLVYYVILGLFLAVYHHKEKISAVLLKKGLVYTSLVLAVIVIWFMVLSPSVLKVTFINVGLGDCTLIQTPQGQTILIDGGGSRFFDVGRYVVLPYLRSQGINKIDYLILSHGDTDHLHGLLVILEKIPVKTVWEGKTNEDSENYRKFRQLIKEKGINHQQIDRRQTLVLSQDSGLIFLAPTQPFLSGTSSDVNNNSVVVKLVYKKVSFLFTGDIGREGEKKLVEENSAYLKADVLKVPHHGSRSSSTEEFIRIVKPEISVISVGKNHFNLPSPEVIEKLEKEKSRIYRTDNNGTIIIYSNGEKYWVRLQK